MEDRFPLAWAVPDAIESVIGWRAWRLLARRGGGLELASVFHLSQGWPARRAMRASCIRHSEVRSFHRAPSGVCSCGVYALARPNALPAAYAVMGGEPAVVGSVALWGKVIEHSDGHRAEFAYPDRIRLVCPWCLKQGFAGIPDRVVAAPGGTRVPVCTLHARANDVGRPAQEVQARLLSTYAVDLLPVEALRDAGFDREEPVMLEEPVMPKVIATGHRAREARTQVLLAVIVAVLAFPFVRATGLVRPDSLPTPPRPPAAVFSAPPAVDTPAEVVESPVRAAPTERRRPSRSLEFALVCAGELPGGVARIRGCARPNAGLFGFARSPARPRSSCWPGGSYSRRQRFSVCWFDLDSNEARVLRLPGVRWWHLRA